jgi:hypothetical protein
MQQETNKFKSYRVLRHLNWQIATDILKNRSAFSGELEDRVALGL